MFAVIDAEKANDSITRMTELLGVSRSGLLRVGRPQGCPAGTAGSSRCRVDGEGP